MGLLLDGGARGDEAPSLPRYRLDSVHTRVQFEVSHAGFSQSLGSFKVTQGALLWDHEQPQTARLDVAIDVRSLDLGDTAWNRKMLRSRFFDARMHPEARFIAEGFRAGQTASQWIIEGRLSLNGITQPIVLNAHVNALRRHPLTLRRTLGVSAQGRLSRRAFGMDAWPKLVGDEVLLRIESEWQREGRDDEMSDDAENDRSASEKKTKGPP